MTLLRLLLGWAVVAVWFLAFELIEQRISGPPAAGGKHLRAPIAVYLADALLLTLFAGLWFASLGHGGWVLLFGVLGLLMEGPMRVRDRSEGIDRSRMGIVRIISGVVRTVVAGGLLAWRFGSLSGW